MISRWSLFRRGGCYTVCRILVPRPGIQADQWTAREFGQDDDGRAFKARVAPYATA